MSATPDAVPTPDAARALREAFGDTPWELSVLKGGRSGATVLSVTVAGTGYVLRQTSTARPGAPAQRELACMTIASEHGVAPRIRHIDPDAGIVIMERIEGPAFARDPRQLGRVARTLRRLHQGPAFPRGVGAAPAVEQLDVTLRTRGLGGLASPLVATMKELARLTLPFAETAPCHNDLNPGNILNGARDVTYFVDWDAACASDPFFDLGSLGVFAFPAAEAQRELLELYLGRRPTEGERARATVARVMALGFYSAAFTYLAIPGRGAAIAPSESEIPPSAAPLPMAMLLASLTATQGPPAPEVVAASLFGEMQRESRTDAFEAATRTLDTAL